MRKELLFQPNRKLSRAASPTSSSSIPFRY
jgi:hypothetical protein